MSDETPIVPKRPTKKQSLETTASDIPLIPKRPVKAPESPVIPRRPTKNSTNTETEVSNSEIIQLDERVDQAITSNNDDIPVNEVNAAPNLGTAEDESILNSEVNDSDGNDGEKTPGNSDTKASFKNDISDTGDCDNEASSFDDDLETVQEDVPGQQAESITESEIIGVTEPDTQSGVGASFQLPNSASETIADEEHVSIKKMDSVEPSEMTKTDSGEKKKESSEAENDDYFVDEGDNSGPVELAVETQKANETLNEGSDGDTFVIQRPVIPQRPQRKIENAGSTEDSKAPLPVTASSESPVIPARPTSKSGANEKPKAPPPKPKKLSSKIAAFQQMFNQPTPPEVGSAGSSSDNGGQGKLSSEKMKFAQNLKGMMGRGVALPGMVNPLALRPLEEKEAHDEDEEASENPDTDVAHKPPVRQTRARGPRGKRLPANLTKPITIEAKPRFETNILDLWLVNFKRVDVEKLSTETQSINSDGEEGSLPEKQEHDASESTDVKSNSPVLEASNLPLLDSEPLDTRLVESTSLVNGDRESMSTQNEILSRDSSVDLNEQLGEQKEADSSGSSSLRETFNIVAPESEYVAVAAESAVVAADSDSDADSDLDVVDVTKEE